MLKEETKMANIAAKEKKFTTLKDSQFDQKANVEADHAIREMDRVLRWKKVHDLLRKNNKKARKEQDVTAEDAKYFRDNGFIKKTKTKAMGLRFGVAMPPTTYHALVQADIIATGKSDLQSPDKEAFDTKDATNQIVRDLEKAFPQYKVS